MTVVIGGVVRNVYRRKSVLTNPTSEMRLISDSTTRSNLTKKLNAKAAYGGSEYNQIVTRRGGLVSLWNFENPQGVERYPRIGFTYLAQARIDPWNLSDTPWTLVDV